MDYPKFLLGQNWLVEPDNFYIIHLANPRFLIKGDMATLVNEHEIVWLDDPPEDKAQIKLLVDEALKYYEEETYILKKGGQTEE